MKWGDDDRCVGLSVLLRGIPGREVAVEDREG